jgi:hypothetical protein
VRHEEASTRLPDLLEDRDDAALLAHVRECPDCQRQLFLLGRVDRLLRESASRRRPMRARRPAARGVLAAVVVVAAASTVLALVAVRHGPGHEMMFRTASGRAVGHAIMGHSDSGNDSLVLVADALPVTRGRAFVLWAADTPRAPMLVASWSTTAALVASASTSQPRTPGVASGSPGPACRPLSSRPLDQNPLGPVRVFQSMSHPTNWPTSIRWPSGSRM